MKIAPKIVFLFLPLLVGPLVFVALSASVSARNGITDVATDLLRFKAEELVRYASTQYRLLEEHGLLETAEFVDASQQSIASHARGIIRRESELVFAAADSGSIAFSSGPIDLAQAEEERVSDIVEAATEGWIVLEIGGIERVAHVIPFPPFGWSFFVTNEADSFYLPVATIFRRSGIALIISLVITTILAVTFSTYLTRPLKQIVRAMREIVTTGNLSRRVQIQFADEIGELGSDFNMMIRALHHAYGEIKNYALQAAVAARRETKVRKIFQKYVPNEVIEQYFASPESMLLGQERKLAILFSDIRGFTTLSEGLSPQHLVESLNRYFSLMVETIMEKQGVVDKYIGDAIMAFFGAPAPDKHSCIHAVSAALGMLDELEEFNRRQKLEGYPPFQIGLGINYGLVTIGNIGSDKKMDYTVIGDEVNLASRLEGLTKWYGEPIIISEPVRRELGDTFPCRMVDRVVVKGKTRPVAIYGVRREITDVDRETWKHHERGLNLYYQRDFTGAYEEFQTAVDYTPSDKVDQLFLRRSYELSQSGVPDDWSGVQVLEEK